MAKRLATAYVKTHIRLTEAEMIEFVELFREFGVHIHVKVYDNGVHEVVLENGDGSEVTLNFEQQKESYVFDGTCCFYETAPANAMRKAIRTFKGSAIAQRHYHNFMMEYCYEHGLVVRITERSSGGHEKVIYRYRNKVVDLQAIYERTDIEKTIEQTKEEINRLLDLRLKAAPGDVVHLDAQLAELSHKLFALEA